MCTDVLTFGLQSQGQLVALTLESLNLPLTDKTCNVLTAKSKKTIIWLKTALKKNGKIHILFLHTHTHTITRERIWTQGYLQKVNASVAAMMQPLTEKQTLFCYNS